MEECDGNSSYLVSSPALLRWLSRIVFRSYYREEKHIVHWKCRTVSGALLCILYGHLRHSSWYNFCTKVWIMHLPTAACLLWIKNLVIVPVFIKNDVFIHRSRPCPRSRALRRSLWCMWWRTRTPFLTGRSPAASSTSWLQSWWDTFCSTRPWSSLSVSKTTTHLNNNNFNNLMAHQPYFSLFLSKAVTQSEDTGSIRVLTGAGNPWKV